MTLFYEIRENLMGKTRQEILKFNFDHKSNPPFVLMALFCQYFALIFTPNSLGANRQSSPDAETIAKYKAASPMNHTVKITRTGSVLKLDYQLIGTDGKIYNLWNIRDQNKPTFTIYHGNVKVGGGEFEFG